MGLFNRMIRKFVKFFTSLQEEEIGKSIPLLPSSAKKEMLPLEETLDEELTKAAKEFSKTTSSENNSEIEKLDLSQ